LGLGPGEYSPEKCDLLIKPNARLVDFANSTGRKSLTGDANLGPGTYKHTSSFDNLPPMTI
jgi:Sperm-tail PG-rich repeat